MVRYTVEPYVDTNLYQWEDGSFETSDTQNYPHTSCERPSFYDVDTSISEWKYHGAYHRMDGDCGYWYFSWSLYGQDLKGRLLLW